ncbi:MAG TPA: Uma2 family endonuclease [Chloroflexota bacterium]|nr:Uma2 family endonuclease [Chloroflexota bacterium]
MKARTLRSDTLAPWGEIVPDAGLMTVEGLLRWAGDESRRYEVVEGVLVRVAGSSPKAVRVTMRLLRVLDAHVEDHRLGQVTPPDAVYDFERTGQPNTGLLPDIGFYYVHREALVLDDQPYPFAPDLAVEIASPSQKQEDLDAKARRYLAGGTSLVWVVWPDARAVDVWRAADRLRPSKTLGVGDMLDGEDVVGGFTYPIAGLFR